MCPLLQASSTGFTPATIILALAGVITTLGGLLLRGWQERVKRSEEAERAATVALLKAKEDELARTGQDRDEWRERAQYLEDQRAQLTRRLLEVKASQSPPSETQRSRSPNPGTSYSVQTSTKTRRSET